MSEQWTAPGSDPTRPPEVAPSPPGAHAGPTAPADPTMPAPTPPPSAPHSTAGAPVPPWGHVGNEPGGAGAPGGSWAAPQQPSQTWPPVPQPGWRPGFDFQPGIIPLRPLQLGDLYSALIKAIRGNVAATVGLAALTSALFLVPTTALGALLASLDAGMPFPTGDSSIAGPEPTLGPAMFSTYLPTIGSALSAILLAGFMAYVIGQAILGRKVGLGETWAGTKSRLPALIGATLLIAGLSIVLMVVGVGVPIGVAIALAASGVDLGAGVIALLVIAFILWVIGLILSVLYVTTRLSFVTPGIVLGQAGVIDSITRSWRLVGGLRRAPFWRILGIRMLTGLIVSVASSIVTLPIMAVFMVVMFGTISGGGTTSTLYLAQTVMTGLVGILAGALTTPFSAGIDALLYVDARMRSEGLDVTLMRACDGSGPLPWPSAAPR